MTILKVKRVYPIAGNIKYMGAEMENGKHTTIYYSDGYSPDYGHPFKVDNNTHDTAVKGNTCIYEL